MSLAQVHLGNIGTMFLVTMKDQDGTVITDLNLLDEIDFIFQKPDESTVTKSGSLYTDGSDGKLYYTTRINDLDQEGIWILQVKVIYNNGNVYHSDKERFRVFNNLT